MTELSASALLTGCPGLPQLGSEIERELASADRFDMLVSFIKSGGIRLLRGALRDFTARGGQLRIITTSYLGASDPAAIEELASMPNTEVRINYNTHSARLHAKAYFFIRESGLSTAYIGSANFSQAAMFELRQEPDGLVKIVDEKHYVLVPADQIGTTDLASYRRPSCWNG